MFKSGLFVSAAIVTICSSRMVRADATMPEEEAKIVHNSVEDFSGRFFRVDNTSLVITYTGAIVAVVMIASFLWLAASYGNNRSYGRRKRRNAMETDGLENMAALMEATINFYESHRSSSRQARTEQISCQEYAEFCLIGDKVRQNNLEMGEALPLVFSALSRSGSQDFRSSLKTFLTGLQGRDCTSRPPHCR